MGLGLSIEVSIIFYIVMFIMFLVTVYNMIKIKNIRILNDGLDNNSEEYKKVQKSIWNKVALSFLFISILEFTYCLFNRLTMCMCGHLAIKMLPILNYAIVQSIISIYILNTLDERKYKVSFIVGYMIISIILFIITIMLFRNDLDALHGVI